MIEWGEVTTIKDEPAFLRRLATRLRAIKNRAWTTKAKAFLEEDVAPLREDHWNADGFFISSRKAEFLDFREKSERVESFKGFNFQALIDACQNRLDLEFDGDVDCIAAPPSLTLGAWRD